MFKLLSLVVTAASLQGVLSLPPTTTHGINLWKLNQQKFSPAEDLAKDTVSASFPLYNFTQPLDHFSNATNVTFSQNYWLNTRHYKPGSGGPVIVVDGGEGPGTARFGILDTGIIDILCRATGGLGLILEHRYYGNSVPVTDFSTDSLRWLNNAQALEDSANFMANVKFPGIDEDLTAPNTPWIYYGGSYAGARAAHMKVLYPDLVFGSIASSGVVHADNDMWEYMDIIRRYAESDCSAHLVNFAKTIDDILETPLNHSLKALFGLDGLSHDYDFVNTIEGSIGSWQGRNWDPAIGDTTFDEYCTMLNTPVTNISSLVDYTLISEAEVQKLANSSGFDLAIFNYAKWVRENIVPRCPEDSTVEDCFGSFDEASYQGTDLGQTWRLWVFQFCTQWGYLITAPPETEVAPRIISRLHTIESESRICRMSFPPGEYFSIPKLPNVTSVNELGDFGIAADRLAIIDGEQDPWRPMTAHSDYFAKNRSDTNLRPFKTIPGAVHHWDENGLQNLTAEPDYIQKIHGDIIEFVTQWLGDRAET